MIISVPRKPCVGLLNCTVPDSELFIVDFPLNLFDKIEDKFTPQ
ncbi:MAG: hypothetical protein WAT89_06385 [Candidatus Kapaibacterium sp.]